MKYLSVASGIEAATVAWHPLGWEAVAYAQFDPDHNYRGGPDFASAVLKTHYPDVPNFGDMTKFEEWPDADVDVLVGGTPCQSFSVAGLRGGLDDVRGNLMLTYGAIARKYRPRWLAWENVPGVLSSDGGRDFASLLGLLAGRRVEVPVGGWETAGIVPGYKSAYGLAWRVLDTQFVRVDGFGRAIPQRRRRVFVVGYLGDWRRAAAVLFERESLSGNPAPRRESGKGFAHDVAPSLVRSGRGVERTGETRGQDPLIAEVAPTLSEVGGHARPGDNLQSVGYLIPAVANPLTARMHKGVNTTMDEGQTMIGESLAFKPSHFTRGKDGALAPVAPPLSADADKGDHDTMVLAFQPRFARNDRGAPIEGASYPLTAEAGRTGKGDSAQCVAFAENSRAELRLCGGDGQVMSQLTTGGGKPGQGQPCIASQWAVRRLTPEECERLQGFPDGYTNVPWRGKNGAPDGPRYRVLGNSMSTNVMRWLGRRIEMVDGIAK